MKFLISLVCLSVLVASVISSPAKSLGAIADEQTAWLNNVAASVVDGAKSSGQALVDNVNEAGQAAGNNVNSLAQEVQNDPTVQALANDAQNNLDNVISAANNVLKGLTDTIRSASLSADASGNGVNANLKP